MELTGEIETIIYRNETNGYTIANMIVDSEEITLVGYLPFVNKGDYIKVITKEGQTKNGKKYQRFDDYTVYFFDVETYTLYYIHGNI